MEMLRYADELRDPAEYFDEVPSAKPQKGMIDLAVQLVDKKSGSFEPKRPLSAWPSISIRATLLCCSRPPTAPLTWGATT
jgi:hypothetical protein